MSLQDPQVSRTRNKLDQIPPKLRKNRKLELRWGNDYYDAVNKAVFSNDYLPYMPSEPPASIKEDIDKTGYVCKQCKDCFRFLSSIEEHTSRRSWILGYWCQSCFATKCTHVAKKDSTMCSSCRNVEASKHAYLAEKGVRRNLKKAVTRVFYNQCQFFAHLRLHGIATVDLSEIMLMPLPSGIEKEDYGQLDKLCKALMETMFIRRIHVMDWLREMNIQPSRWRTLLSWMESKQKNPLTDIMARYSDNCLNVMDLAKRTRKDNLDRQSQNHDESMKIDSSLNEEKDPLANDDDDNDDDDDDDDDSPNDIAFVDCGPTPSHVITSDFPGGNATQNPKRYRTCDRRTNLLWRSFSEQYEKRKEKSGDLTKRKSEERVDSSSSSSSSMIVNRNSPRVLTIRSPKSLSLSTIIKHLPIDGINSKKIIVVADDSEAENNASTITDRSTNNPGQALEMGSKDKTKSSIPETNKKNETNLRVNPSAGNDACSKGVASLTKSQSFSEQMSLHGRIVFQNGRKYIIRHVPKSKSQSILQDSIVKKLRNPPPLITPISGTKIPLLPKQSPVTKNPPSAIESLQKSLRSSKRVNVPSPNSSSPFPVATIKANSNPQSNKSGTTKIQRSLLMKCREALMNDLRRSTKNELESYIRHLKGINERYSKATNLENDSTIAANDRVVALFESVASSLPKSEETDQDCKSVDSFETNPQGWEKRMKEEATNRKCEICEKIVKRAYYIIGISSPAIDETIYCHCYNNVCYICQSNQDNLVQLKAHVKWHKGEKPYACPSCSIVFPSFVELEIHVWTSCFHPIAGYTYGCGVCEIAGLPNMESVAQHFSLLHTRRKIICPECKIEYSGKTLPTRTDHLKHFEKHHPEVTNIMEPKELLICNLKQCIVRPELFRAHLSDHIGIVKCIYYKCPFCKTTNESLGRDKASMRKHLAENHLDRMEEIVSKESLQSIIDALESTSASTATISQDGGEICQVLNADPTGPKILDARTITPATFEFGSEALEELTNIEDSKLPKILDVRSEAIEEFEETRTNDFELEILSVKSMTDNSSDSPMIDCDNSNFLSTETSDELNTLNDTSETITLRMNSSLIRERIECEDSSNSHEEITVISMDSKIDDSELESYDGNRLQDEEKISRNRQTCQRPWRIALNSPTDVETKPIVYNCHLCGELINTSWSVIKNHFDNHHSSDYEIFTVSPNIPRVATNFNDESDYREDSTGSENKKRKMDISPPSGNKRRRRWGPKKHIERPGSPSLGICVKQEPVQEIEGSFRCKKCDRLFSDRSMLRQHIAIQHRIKGQYLICLECGENFVVVPSLQMHLKALHGIEDPITYLSKNTAYAPEILDDTEEDEKAMESNQCYVCMAVFEDKPALDKHIRVHGMAFLRRKKFEAQKALKLCTKINVSSETTKTGNDDEKSTNLQNHVESIKKEEISDSNETRLINNDKFSKDFIQQIDKTITEVEKVEAIPIT